MKFSIRDLLWFTVVVALCLSLVYVKWPTGIGRYQMSSGGPGPNYILDTATGKSGLSRPTTLHKMPNGLNTVGLTTASSGPTLQHPPQTRPSREL